LVLLGILAVVPQRRRLLRQKEREASSTGLRDRPHHQPPHISPNQTQPENIDISVLTDIVEKITEKHF